MTGIQISIAASLWWGGEILLDWVGMLGSQIAGRLQGGKDGKVMQEDFLSSGSHGVSIYGGSPNWGLEAESYQ